MKISEVDRRVKWCSPIIALLVLMPACGKGIYNYESLPPTVNGQPHHPPLVPLSSIDDDHLRDQIDKIIAFNSQLEPNLWDDMTLNPHVAEKVKALSNLIVGQLNVPGVGIAEVTVMGSIASYEYDDQSDFDVDIFLDTSNYAGDTEMLKLYVTEFNRERRIEYRDVNFYGYPVEIKMFVDSPANQLRHGMGTYSIMKERWEVLPELETNNFDKNQIFSDSKNYISQYNAIAELYNSKIDSADCSRFSYLKSNLWQYRTEGINAQGIRSTPNLTYRGLFSGHPEEMQADDSGYRFLEC